MDWQLSLTLRVLDARALVTVMGNGKITLPPMNLYKERASYFQPKVCYAKYDINLRFCLALQLMVVGREHARILTSFLDLPESYKWPNLYRTFENFLHQATEEVKHESQQKAADTEVILTNVPSSNIEQTLLEHEVPRYRVEASYDMGWQVHSSGGKYGSSTGHGLLIRVLSK